MHNRTREEGRENREEIRDKREEEERKRRRRGRYDGVEGGGWQQEIRRVIFLYLFYFVFLDGLQLLSNSECLSLVVLCILHTGSHLTLLSTQHVVYPLYQLMMSKGQKIMLCGIDLYIVVVFDTDRYARRCKDLKREHLPSFYLIHQKNC